MKRIGFLVLLLASTSYAGSPLWTFTPLTATTISVPSSGTATIQYQVTNQSSKAHTLDMQNIPGITQVTTAGNCTDPFPLDGKQSCILTLSVNGSALSQNVVGGPIVCEQGSTLQCYQPSAQDSLNITLVAVAPATTLSVSLAELALEISGNARIITVTNTGSHVAENLLVNYSGLPTGTAEGSTCGSTLNPSGSCTVTITPGANATSDCNAGQGSAPTPGEISVTGDNTNTVETDVLVLTYGCIYQEGYIFAIDDTTPTTSSIAGANASLSDNANIDWGSSSITTSATSLTDGAANTALIVGSNTGTFAAKICTEFEIDDSGNSPCVSGVCYTNWYLPAICQMGASGGSAGCSTGTPNIETNLQSLITSCSGSECLSAEHWSSTEFTSTNAWYEYYLSGSPSIQQQANKSITLPVRCVRDF